MSDINLRVRYFQDSTPKDVPCREENFIRREIEMKLPVKETALVVVDIWDTHHIKSYVERMDKVLEDKVLPVLAVCRKLGMAIIHAPCPEIAHNQFASKLDKFKTKEMHMVAESIWPPKEFRSRGENSNVYHSYRHPRLQPPGVMSERSRSWNLSPRIDVRSDESVIADGTQLDLLCKEQGILHLIYVGFLANWCMLGRDYGIRAKSGQGYNTILLRDATMGSEYPDTLKNLFTTEMAVREVETQWGFSASNTDFLPACEKLLRY